MLLVRRRAVPAGSVRVGVALLGAIDGVNQTFTTPETFVQTPPGLSIALFWNGVRQELGGDYTVSGGFAGQGTTLTMLFTPRPGDKLLADYVAA